MSAYDGTRELIPAGESLLFRVVDGDQKEVVAKSQQKPVMRKTIPIADNLRDRCRVIVSGANYQQAGFYPVVLKPDKIVSLDLMLLPATDRFDFRDAEWNQLRMTHPKWTSFLCRGRDGQTAYNQYLALMENKPPRLAGFLNFAEALSDVRFPNGVAFDYLQQPLTDNLDQSCFVDRFFAFAEQGLVKQLEDSVEQGTFQHAISTLHPGATRSFKEVRLGEANLQITLHENDRQRTNSKSCLKVEIDMDYLQITLHENDRQRTNSKSCLKVEIDMDYYRDNLSHILLEVMPNQFGGNTDPCRIYVLRWIAGRQAGISDFNPPYKITNTV